MKVLAAILVITAAGSAQGVDFLGENLLPSTSFETDADWILNAGPDGQARFILDGTNFLAGARALRVELPDTGSAQIVSPRIPVQGGQWYLLSIGYRSEGFGERGYAGVDASARLMWLDGEGRSARSPGGLAVLAFPYGAADWDVRDGLVRAPTNAVSAELHIGFSNRSRQVVTNNIPSTMWFDAVQLRAYRPPATPDWATRPVARIVQGAPDTSTVRVFPLAGQGYVGGNWSKVVVDPNALFGIALASTTNAGRGIMFHTPYLGDWRPGLYRAVIRAKAADRTTDGDLGVLDVISEQASTRAILSLRTPDFREADVYQEFTMDFILRGRGWFCLRGHTAGQGPFVLDTARIFPLQQFNDLDLLSIYPGSDGVVADALRPPVGDPLRVLLVAGLGYDRWRIGPALRLAGYHAMLDSALVQGGRIQRFEGLPESVTELFRYHVVVLCNVDAGSLGLRQKRWIVEYVRRGGGLVVLGGHKTFDRGAFRESLLDELLPVECRSNLSAALRHFPAGGALSEGANHPATRDADFGDRPVVYWMHDAAVRPGALTLATVHDQPAIVVGKPGGGRVACVMMAALGDDGDGRPPYWDWRSWLLVLRNLVWWTAGRLEEQPR